MNQRPDSAVREQQPRTCATREAVGDDPPPPVPILGWRTAASSLYERLHATVCGPAIVEGLRHVQRAA